MTPALRIIVLTVLIYIKRFSYFVFVVVSVLNFLALTTSVRVGKVECREIEKNKKLRTNYGRFLRDFDG